MESAGAYRNGIVAPGRPPSTSDSRLRLLAVELRIASLPKQSALPCPSVRLCTPSCPSASPYRRLVTTLTTAGHSQAILESAPDARPVGAPHVVVSGSRRHVPCWLVDRRPAEQRPPPSDISSQMVALGLVGRRQAGLHLDRLLNVASVLNRFHVEAATDDQTVL
jgi:hypothetical protein